MKIETAEQIYYDISKLMEQFENEGSLIETYKDEFKDTIDKNYVSVIDLKPILDMIGWMNVNDIKKYCEGGEEQVKKINRLYFYLRDFVNTKSK